MHSHGAFFQQHLAMNLTFSRAALATNDRRLRVSRQDGPEAKNPRKIISQRPTRDRVSDVPHATVFRICWKNLFPLALASAMMNKSPLVPTYASKACAWMYVCVCMRARARSTLLNSFLYYVFSESKCNLPSRPPLSPPLAFSLRKPEGRGFPTPRQGNKYPRTNYFCHLTSARRNDLIRITYRNA